MKRPRLFLIGGFWTAFLAALLVSGGTGLGVQKEVTLLPSMWLGQHQMTGAIILAEQAPDEGSYQVPVKEGEELPDRPAADETHGDAESQMPAVEQPPAGAEVPPANQPPEVPQPGATP